VRDAGATLRHAASSGDQSDVGRLPAPLLGQRGARVFPQRIGGLRESGCLCIGDGVRILDTVSSESTHVLKDGPATPIVCPEMNSAEETD